MLIAGNNVEVKKHVGAIHVKGALLLLQRKAANALLLNAYEELPDDSVKEHTVRVSDLAAAIGYDSNDHETLKKTLEALVDLKVTWNLLDPAGQREWGVGSFLASARIKAGVCRYAYPAPLRELLYNPQIYARVNLAVQTRFSSGPALALYENCLRFLKVGTTGWISIDDWRGLLGVGDGQYPEYKRFRSKVLVPAVEQINTHSDIRVEMETKREKRRVVALRFSVERGPAVDESEIDVVIEAVGGSAATVGIEGDVPDPASGIHLRLGEFGLTEAQSANLLAGFATDRVERNLSFVEARMDAGDAVKNLAAYTLAAVRGDYATSAQTPDVVLQASEKKREAAASVRQRQEQAASRKEAESEAKRAAQARQRQALAAVWTALSEAERAAFTERAVARLCAESPQVYRWYEEELSAGKKESEMRPSVRTTLQSYRHEEVERLL